MIVDPSQPGCAFASKQLAGVGVAFYVLLALRAELRERGSSRRPTQPRLDALLDLVALGTVADVVRLDRNNRCLVAQGLKRIRAGRMQPGVAALFAAAGRDPRQASAGDFGFALGPRLNAAGRLADMTLGIECLLTDDPARAAELAGALDAINRERRTVEAGMREQAERLVDRALAAAGEVDAAFAVYDPDFHEGVVGIIASRLKDRLHRPTFVFALGQDGALKGSGRSVEGLHLRDALDLVSKRHPGVLKRFGGHAMAAGCTIALESLDLFRSALQDAAREPSAPRRRRSASPATARSRAERLDARDRPPDRGPGLGRGVRGADLLRCGRGALAAPGRREAPEARGSARRRRPRRDLVRPGRAGRRAAAPGLPARPRQLQRHRAAADAGRRRRGNAPFPLSLTLEIFSLSRSASLPRPATAHFRSMELHITGLSKTYANGVRALDDVSASSIPTGMFGLLGPNGAGKSTLMRTLATLQDADHGSAQLVDAERGTHINVLRDKAGVRRVLGYLPQDFGVYPKVNAEDMLDHLARLKGLVGPRRAQATRSRRCCARPTCTTCARRRSAASPAACGSASASPRRCSATPS